MNNRWQRAGQRVKPGFKIAGKLVLLEPVLSRAAAKLSKRYSGNQP